MFLKDLREHGTTVVLLMLMVLLFDALVLLFIDRAGFTVSRLDGIRLVHLFALPLVQLTLGNRLVVREYAQGTALWLDSLPLHRHNLVLSKYVFGLLVSALASLAITVPFVVVTWHSDLLDSGFLVLLLARTLGWTLMGWSLVFCISHFGSLRYLLYLLILGGLLFASNASVIDQSRLAPFALMGADRFAFDRLAVPAWALWQAAALSAAALLVVWLLVRGRRRALLERLAAPVGRSGWFLLVALVLVMLTVGTVLQREPVPDVAAEAGDYVLVHRDPDITLHIGDPVYRAQGEARLAALADWLPQLQSTLSEERLPPVRITFDTQLDEGEMRLQGLAAAGVIVNPRYLDADTELLMDVAIVHELLSQFSRGRGDFEPYHWLLDGASWWLQLAQAGEEKVSEVRTGEQRSSYRTRLLAHARLTAQQFDTVPDLSANWQRLADRHGYGALGALAWSLVAYLVETEGSDRLLRLLRETQLTPATDSLRAVLDYRRLPFQSRFTRLYARPWQDVLRGWWRWLTVQEVPAWVDAVPRVRVTATLAADSDGRERLEASLDWSGALPDTMSDLHCRLGYSEIGPFDYETWWPDKRSESTPCSAAITLSLTGPFRPGARLYVTLEAESAALIEPLRLYADRLTVPR